MLAINNDLIRRIFYLLLIVVSIYILGLFFGIELDKNIWFRPLFLGLPVLLLLLHAVLTLSYKKAALLIILSSITGFLMEVWGLSSGVIFGGYYVYDQNQLLLFGVPVSVIFYWAVFIYLGYCLVNSFLIWLKKTKPNIKQHNFLIIPLLCIADGIAVTAIDLFMDPIQVYKGAWTWFGGGAYFSIPIGNFVGWFLVTIIVTGLFRTYEYFKPKKQEFDKSIYIIPVLEYGVLALTFAFTALVYQMYSLVIIGSLLMLPPVVFSIILFLCRGERN